MRLISKYKILFKLKDTITKIPLRILKFHRTKWKKIQTVCIKKNYRIPTLKETSTNLKLQNSKATKKKTIIKKVIQSTKISIKKNLY